MSIKKKWYSWEYDELKTNLGKSEMDISEVGDMLT